MLKINIKDLSGVMHVLTIAPNGENMDIKLVNTANNAERAMSLPATTAAGHSILDMCEQLGLELPYSCRAGACTSCLAEVKTGKEFLNQNAAGEPIIDLTENEFLCCIGGCQSSAMAAPEEKVVDLESKGL